MRLSDAQGKWSTVGGQKTHAKFSHSPISSPMARSPKLTKGQQAQLSKRQAGKVQRAADKAEDAANTVNALKTQRDQKRGAISSLKDGLHSLESKLAGHPLTQKVNAKKDQIQIERSALQSIVAELDDAKGRLQKALAQRDDVVSSVKQELIPADDGAGDSDDDDSDGDDD